MKNKLMQKLQKNSTIKEADILAESKFFENVDVVSFPVPIMNVAFSGDLDGGLIPGVHMFAGPSKHGKSVLGLLGVKAYMDAKPESALLFYDSEFGSPRSYFDAYGIDADRVLHCPLQNIEKLKFDIIQQLEGFDETDDVIIFIDSIGNVASKKEIEDALNEKSAADMTRAKQLKSLFRMVTPYLRMKNIPMIVINHTYKSQDLFPKDVVGGGCLAENTLIRMADGTNKEVQLIEVGELVKTLDGDKEVTATWNPETLVEGEPECYEIEFEDGTKYVTSDTHPFLITDTGDNDTRIWVDAMSLKVGDMVISAE